MPKKSASIDVEEIFLDPGKVAAILEAGKTIKLLDDHGKVFARVEPIAKASKEPAYEKAAQDLLTHAPIFTNLA